MILEDIKEYRQRGEISKLKTKYFKLPCKKINISCSEVIEEQGINYFINIVNAPEPYIIISYYENEKYNTWINAKKKEFEDEKYKSFYMYDFILSFIITNAQNIYMNKRKFIILNFLKSHINLNEYANQNIEINYTTIFNSNKDRNEQHYFNVAIIDLNHEVFQHLINESTM